MVEVLVSMIIMAIVTTMILITYFALTSSYSYSANSSHARGDAQQALARLAREIRDAQSLSTGTEVAVIRARQRWILFRTTFNEAGNSNPYLVPHMIMYRLYNDGSLWRFEDLDNDGTLDGVDINPSPDDSFDSDEKTAGEGGRMLLSHVVNYSPDVSPQPPLFDYSYVDENGLLQLSPYVYTPENRGRILTVQIHVLADLNPKHSPIYADLMTSAQLRNQRQH
jgi:type II secretory pathway pseudopilin PulG